jgi:ferric-dicitrate binding protein FerR (iron transport regulator)/tetratricopeptide (TPR) repeat protein
MSATDCERWMELADQAAVGGPLTEKDQAWFSQHGSVCSECSAERQFYASLRDALGRPEMLVVPTRVTTPPIRRAPSRRPLIVGLALAASVAVVLGGQRYLRRPDPASPPLSSAISAQVVFASGDARLGSLPAETGQQVPQGERLSTDSGLACMAMAGSIDVCLDGASAAIFTLSEPDRILVYLEKGALMARLDHQPVGRKFFVRTAGAELQAVGTRFSVRLSEDGNMRVRLHEGRLAVRAANRVSTDLVAPVQASIAQDIRVASMSAAAIGEDKLLADLVEAARFQSGASLTITSTPAGADVLLDNLAMGKTPVSMYLRASAHVRLSLQGYEPISDWIACEACGLRSQRGAARGAGSAPKASASGTASKEASVPRRIERAFTLTALAAASSEDSGKPSHPRPGVARVSPDRLLAKAQSLRAQGQYESCAQLYRRLRSEFPGSEEAKVSMISLGELELLRTKNPVAALDAFNAYLRLGGSLDREARFGKIRALRALGRRAEADAETARFMRDYPSSIQAATLRRQSHGN